VPGIFATTFVGRILQNAGASITQSILMEFISIALELKYVHFSFTFLIICCSSAEL
jgi:hypothetical protein